MKVKQNRPKTQGVWGILPQRTPSVLTWAVCGRAPTAAAGAADAQDVAGFHVQRFLTRQLNFFKPALEQHVLARLPVVAPVVARRRKPAPLRQHRYPGRAKKLHVPNQAVAAVVLPPGPRNRGAARTA